MSDLNDIKERLIKLEIALENVVDKISASADDRKWLLRIILGGLLSAIVVWISKGGLVNVL